MRDEDIRRQKARAARYMRPALTCLGAAYLEETLRQVYEDCGNVEYYCCDEPTRDVMLSAFDGDEDELNEYRLAFADLASDVERTWERIYGGFDADDYEDNTLGILGVTKRDVDDCLVSAFWGSASVSGYDTYECDWFELDRFELNLAVQKASERLMRKTKKEMIEAFHNSFGLFLSCYDLIQRYDKLKTVLDILCGDELALLDEIKRIDELWRKNQDCSSYEINWHEFDYAVAKLPDRVWVE